MRRLVAYQQKVFASDQNVEFVKSFPDYKNTLYFLGHIYDSIYKQTHTTFPRK